MAHGLVIVDDETVGSWKTIDGPRQEILLTFDTVKAADSLLELAREHGASLSMLEWQTDPTLRSLEE